MNNSKKYLTKNQLEKIKNPNWFSNIEEYKYEYSDARVFLQGSCQLFAYALNEKYGYDIVEIKQGTSLHYCCTLYQNGTQFWVDVRGATSDRTIFIGGLKYITEGSCTYIEHNSEEVQAELKDDGAEFGYSFAKYIIEQCPERYDVSKLTREGIL